MSEKVIDTEKHLPHGTADAIKSMNQSLHT